MPNSYFQFKEFTIHQDRSAMKVCTDACLLGAWFAGKLDAGVPSGTSAGELPDRIAGVLPGQVTDASRILDIGSGTGLLMLMLAQKYDGPVHGIELDPAAFGQSKENIADSKWKGRLAVFEGDIRKHVFPNRYEYIICNPPFFEGDLASASGGENLAKHSKELRLTELIGVITANLADTGSFGILLPYHRSDYFEKLAAGNGFQLRERVKVRQTPGHNFFRSILYFSGGNCQGTEVCDTELTIKNAAGNYTSAFTALLKDYYMYL